MTQTETVPSYSNSTSPPLPFNQRENPPTSRKRKIELCKHQCKDKTKCKHQCCKRNLYSPRTAISEPAPDEITRETSEEEEEEINFFENDHPSFNFDTKQHTHTLYSQSSNPPSVPKPIQSKYHPNETQTLAIANSLKVMKDQVKKVESSTFLNPERPVKRLKTGDSPIPVRSESFAPFNHQNLRSPSPAFPQSQFIPKTSQIEVEEEWKNLSSLKLPPSSPSVSRNLLQTNKTIPEIRQNEKKPQFTEKPKQKIPLIQPTLMDFYSKLQRPIQTPKQEDAASFWKENDQELDFSDLFN